MQLILKVLQRGSRAASPQPEAEVLPNAQVGIKGIALEHHGHISLAGADFAHRANADPYFTSRRRFKACQKAQQRAFPAAGWTHKHQEFPVFDGQIEGLENLHRVCSPPTRVGLAQSFELNAGQRQCCSD